MSILAWLVVGLIAGWLTGQVMRGRGYGVVMDIVIGIVGALVGGFLGSALLGIPDPLSGINFGTIIVAFLGGIVAVTLIRALPGRSPV
ncbi:MAG: GlsB/YeaQ/YmgE family stress response membrane protein [Anaerolineae bacterium]|nr:GlsB/YeaQ/YmgE family stress response membrane protein [Anaerolineae bacterium]